MINQLNLKAPNEIDFSDKIEDKPISNEKLDDMIKARENELNNYLPKENTKQLKIGENINLEKNTIEPIKKMKM